MWWIKTRSLLTFRLPQITLRHIWCIHEIPLMYFDKIQRFHHWKHEPLTSLRFAFLFWNSPTLFTSLHTMWIVKLNGWRKKRSLSLSIRFIVFFVLCCSLLNKQQAQKKLSVHSHKTNEKKIEKKSSFLLARSSLCCVDNQCSWILKQNKIKTEREEWKTW
jgi:hypothetical protein